MDQDSYRYCKIFVDGAEIDGVKSALAGAFSGSFERHTMYVGQGLAVEVRENSDADDAEDNDDFLYWPVVVELDVEGEVVPGVVVDTTKSILNTLWDAGRRAVAACDFEAELPWNGGIERP